LCSSSSSQGCAWCAQASIQSTFFFRVGTYTRYELASYLYFVKVCHSLSFWEHEFFLDFAWLFKVWNHIFILSGTGLTALMYSWMSTGPRILELLILLSFLGMNSTFVRFSFSQFIWELVAIWGWCILRNCLSMFEQLKLWLIAFRSLLNSISMECRAVLYLMATWSQLLLLL